MQYTQLSLESSTAEVSSLLCSERFFSGYSAESTPVFPSPQKPTFPNSNSILECTGISNEFLWTPGAPLVNKLHLHFFTFTKYINVSNFRSLPSAKKCSISQLTVSILTSSHVCYQPISVQTLYYLVLKPLFFLICAFAVLFSHCTFVRTLSPSYFGSHRSVSWTKRTSWTVFTVCVRDRVSLLPKLSRVLCFAIVSNPVKYRSIRKKTILHFLLRFSIKVPG